MKRYEEKLFQDVQITRDICYATLPGYDRAHTETPLCMDMYAPANDAEKNRRAVILVHGGGFVKCDKTQQYIVILSKLLAQYGYVCFSPDYRLFPSLEERPGLHESARCAALDIEAVRAFIQAHAREYGVDPEKTALAGGSAGGMATLEAARLYPGYFAYVNLWGAYPDARPGDVYPPTLIIHGTKDQLVPVAHGEAFYAKLLEKGIPARLVLLRDAPHTAIQWLPEYEDTLVSFLHTYAG